MPSTSNIVPEGETETQTVSLGSGIASTNVDAGEGGMDVVNSWNLCMCVCVIRSGHVMLCRYHLAQAMLCHYHVDHVRNYVGSPVM